MTYDFKADAEKYVEETDYIDNLNRNLAGNAFIAGAARGVEVGKGERDQLKAQISKSESAYRVLARTEEMFRKELIAERNLMQAQLAVAEEILSQMTCAGPNHGGAIKMAYDYFSKRGAR